MIHSCEKCGTPLAVLKNMYHWGGQYFSGEVCLNCNALWPVGEGYIKFMEAVKNSAENKNNSLAD